MLRPLVVAFCLLALIMSAVTVRAQAVSVRAPYPQITAADRDWLPRRAPILFAGDRYYPAGPAVHYNPDVMVETGSFDGVPLYADTSVEPYSQVLVPIGRGLMQPYERRREGDLAGTTGSRTPSFPVDLRPDTPIHPAGSVAEVQAGSRPAPPGIPAPPPEPARQGGLVSARTPDGNRGIWIRYEGRRWEAAGEAVPLDAGFRKVGDYRGFPVYERADAPGSAVREIYVPSRDEMLAPYRVAEPPSQ